MPGMSLVLTAVGQVFVVQLQKSTGAAPVAAAAKALKEASRKVSKRGVPLLIVPFMGEVGKRVCVEAGIAWGDLSGNGRVIAPRLRVIVDGRPNRFRAAGRPSNLFAPKSARVTRWLLMHPHEAFAQRHLARATDMTEGFVSRIVSNLAADGYVTREPSGAIRAKDPALLLDAWREAYQFSKHQIYRGHVAARSGDALLKFVADTLTAQGVDYAATGLAAAWAFTHFAAFRTTTVYVPEGPSPALFEQLGYRDDPRGANLWLVVPNDAGVFQGATNQAGVRCVHPVQAYVDLKEQPERSPEAAEHLRADLPKWTTHG